MLKLTAKGLLSTEDVEFDLDEIGNIYTDDDVAYIGRGYPVKLSTIRPVTQPTPALPDAVTFTLSPWTGTTGISGYRCSEPGDQSGVYYRKPQPEPDKAAAGIVTLYMALNHAPEPFGGKATTVFGREYLDWYEKVRTPAMKSTPTPPPSDAETELRAALENDALPILIAWYAIKEANYGPGWQGPLPTALDNVRAVLAKYPAPAAKEGE